MSTNLAWPKSQVRFRGHVLSVEQSPGANNEACRALQGAQFETSVFNRDSAHRSKSISEYDLVLLEFQFRRREVCLRILKTLREVSNVPIVVLADQAVGQLKIEALELGADDFLSGPSIGRELVARVNSIIRRSRSGVKKAEPSEVLRLDPLTKLVLVRGKPVDLTHREFEILSVLAQASGRNVTREEILRRVWGQEYEGEVRRVDLYVSRIRAKVDQPGYESLICSIYGVGYRLDGATGHFRPEARRQLAR